MAASLYERQADAWASYLVAWDAMDALWPDYRAALHDPLSQGAIVCEEWRARWLTFRAAGDRFNQLVQLGGQTG